VQRGQRRVCLRLRQDLGKEAEAHSLEKVSGAPWPACYADIEGRSARALPADDLLLERDICHPEGAADVVGGAHRYEGKRDATADHALRDVCNGPVAPGDGDKSPGSSRATVQSASWEER